MIGFKQIIVASVVASTIGFTGISQASLYDRGNGLVYDDVLNITATKDVNLFQTQAANDKNLINNIISTIGSVTDRNGTRPLTTSDFSAGSGTMNWWGAQAWVSYLNNQNYDGYNNWRLPNSTNFFGYTYSQQSELAYLFNVELNNQTYVLPNGNLNYSWTGNPNPTFLDAAHSNTQDSLSNYLQAFSYSTGGTYWYGTEYEYFSGNAYTFRSSYGDQTMGGKGAPYYAWAIRSGDVDAVPVPAAFWLFGSGLMGLLGLRRRGNIG